MLVAYSVFDPNESVATPDATVIVPTNKLMNIIIYLTKLLNRGPKKLNTGGIRTNTRTASNASYDGLVFE